MQFSLIKIYSVNLINLLPPSLKFPPKLWQISSRPHGVTLHSLSAKFVASSTAADWCLSNSLCIAQCAVWLTLPMASALHILHIMSVTAGNYASKSNPFFHSATCTAFVRTAALPRLPIYCFDYAHAVRTAGVGPLCCINSLLSHIEINSYFPGRGLINILKNQFHITQFLKFEFIPRKMGHAVAQLVEVLRYKSEGRGFDFRWCHWNFSLT